MTPPPLLEATFNFCFQSNNSVLATLSRLGVRGTLLPKGRKEVVG